jgi:predicted O-methyltransferase YrrM
MTRVAQDQSEFAKFCQLMLAEKARSYLEIGSWKGGSLGLASRVLPRGSRIVSVDHSGHEKLKRTLRDLMLGGYKTHLILGDSMDPKIIAAARALGPYDVVFIDANHSTKYVTSDWKNYGQMGKLIGFHDIARDMPGDPERHWEPCEVHSFWNQLDKSKYKHTEIVSEQSRTRTDSKAVYGIGVVWL